MKNEPHQLRRPSICWSSCSNDMPNSGFVSRSASRRNASAIPSLRGAALFGGRLSPSRGLGRTLVNRAQLFTPSHLAVPVSRLTLANL